MKANYELETGDVVLLMSGGPDMTVLSVKDGVAHCGYFEDNINGYGGYKEIDFPVDVLMCYEE